METETDYVRLHIWRTDDYLSDKGECYGSFKTWEEAEDKAHELMARNEICDFDISVI